MAVICRHYSEMERCAAVLRHRQLPHEVRKGSGTFNPLADTIKLLTMHVSKGSSFPSWPSQVLARCPKTGKTRPTKRDSSTWPPPAQHSD